MFTYTFLGNTPLLTWMFNYIKLIGHQGLIEWRKAQAAPVKSIYALRVQFDTNKNVHATFL